MKPLSWLSLWLLIGIAIVGDMWIIVGIPTLIDIAIVVYTS